MAQHARINPDSAENQAASLDNQREAFALRMEAQALEWEREGEEDEEGVTRFADGSKWDKNWTATPEKIEPVFSSPWFSDLSWLNSMRQP